MKKCKNGVLTVFLCLLLSAMVVVTGTLIEAVRITGARIQAQAVSDSAVDSLFSEYYRPLWDNYHLLFFCGAYGQTAFSAQEVTSHMQEYMDANLSPQGMGLFMPGMDSWKLSHDAVSLSSCVLATDADCAAYRRQAAESVKSLVGEALLEKLKTWAKEPFDMEAMEDSYKQRTAESEAEIGKQQEALKQAQEQAEAGTDSGTLPPEEMAPSESIQDTVEANGSLRPSESAQSQIGAAQTAYDPIALIKEIKKKGILELAAPDPDALSDKEMVTDNCVSVRELQTGIAAETEETEESSADALQEKLLFHEYLMRQFSNAVSTEKVHLENGTALSYELEYLLEGKNSDIQNLKGVAHKLLLLREAVNFAYLLTDESKQLQAEALAVAITGLVGIAPLASAVRYGILLAWAYGESILDVRSLLAGGKAALVKTPQTWQLALENIGELVNRSSGETTEQENGLSYEMYLRLLLFAEDETQLTLRSLDLIEKNMQRQPGGTYFAADALVAQLTAETKFSIQPLFLSLGFLPPYKEAFRYQAQSSKSYCGR